MKTSLRPVAIAAVALALAGCGAQRKLRSIQQQSPAAEVQLPTSRPAPEVEIAGASSDTIKVRDEQGHELILMNALRDEQTGEMVATEELQSACVIARFRNVAERHGEVDLEFLVVVSDSLQDPHWQLRFQPTMYVQHDTIPLDPVYITGEDFRRSQLRGYRLYGKYLKSVSRDSLHFVDKSQLESLMSRSRFGVSEKEAREHYTRGLLVKRNALRLRGIPRIRRKYLHNPIDPGSVRMDSVTDHGEKFVYTYVQTIRTRPGLKKVEVVLEGGIYDEQKCIYRIPKCEPVCFYISSISSFADTSPHYKQIIVERAILESQKCDLAFRAGSAELDLTLGRNAEELERIGESLVSLASESELIPDSVVVLASCSPEGRYAVNSRLASQRAATLETVVRGTLDSVTVITRGISENWALLDSLVLRDAAMRPAEKAAYRRIRRIQDPDAREAELSRQKFYGYLRARHYPALRYVCVKEHLHRRDMVKDTIHTSVLDTTYMKGVKLLEDRQYEEALTVLGPYQDYNTAVAYLSLDYNASAEKILQGLPRTAQNLYMQAIIASRRGKLKDAVQLYLDACAMEPSYRYRGNLDPEIATLIKTYGLNDLLE